MASHGQQYGGKLLQQKIKIQSKSVCSKAKQVPLWPVIDHPKALRRLSEPPQKPGVPGTVPSPWHHPNEYTPTRLRKHIQSRLCIQRRLLRATARIGTGASHKNHKTQKLNPENVSWPTRSQPGPDDGTCH